MAWTKKDLEKLKARGLKMEGRTPPSKKNKKRKSPSAPRTTPRGLIFMMEQLRLRNIKFVTEHRFHKVRRFRFDIAIPDIMVALEYEGLMSRKSGHTTINGYVSDCTKYNLAQLEGWKVLRYTAKNYEDFPNDIDNLKINCKTSK